jgi:hypothetical protein
VKKIQSLFERDYDRHRATARDEILPGSEWVANGEGVATRKWDGTACLVRNGEIFKRYDAKPGRTPPPGFEPCEAAPDPVTGHWPGWVPIDPRAKADAPYLDAFFDQLDGTYELCGPKVNSNHERLNRHVLIRHGADVLDCPRDFEGLRAWLEGRDIEGIVWHHPDGRMVKIKGSDFGLVRP